MNAEELVLLDSVAAVLLDAEELVFLDAGEPVLHDAEDLVVLDAGEAVLIDAEDLVDYVDLDAWIALKNAVGLYFDATKTSRTRIKSINCKKHK